MSTSVIGSLKACLYATGFTSDSKKMKVRGSRGQIDAPSLGV